MYVFFKIPVKTYRQCLRVYRGMEKKKKNNQSLRMHLKYSLHSSSLKLEIVLGLSQEKQAVLFVFQECNVVYKKLEI